MMSSIVVNDTDGEKVIHELDSQVDTVMSTNTDVEASSLNAVHVQEHDSQISETTWSGMLVLPANVANVQTQNSQTTFSGTGLEVQHRDHDNSQTTLSGTGLEIQHRDHDNSQTTLSGTSSMNAVTEQTQNSQTTFSGAGLEIQHRDRDNSQITSMNAVTEQTQNSQTTLSDAVLETQDYDVVMVEDSSQCVQQSESGTLQSLLRYSYVADWHKPPKEVCRCSKEFGANYLKGCKWSPDGTCILTNSSDQRLRLFHLPPLFYETQSTPHYPASVTEMRSELSVREPTLIYDYCWFPHMISDDASTCRFVSTSRDTPIHMYDASTGKLKCSYKAYNHVDELVAAHSLCFTLDGSRLLCGYNKVIRVFDTSCPGRQFTERKTYNKEGQSGIISCIAVSQTQTDLYAAGSYSRQIALYQEPQGDMVCMFQGQQGGVTHLQFSPDGTRLYSGGRKDPEILCWDLRNPGRVLFSAIRDVQTNQRVYFQLDETGNCLMSGNHDGTVTVWDTSGTPEHVEGCVDPVLPSTVTFSAHKDTVNGFSFHPTLPVIATASGQRHYAMGEDSSDSSDSDQMDSPMDNSLKMWLFPPLLQT